MTAVAARGISKRFGAVRALRSVDFDVSAGEVVALAGENGSGKTTLVRIMAGATRADSGHVLVKGTPSSFSTPRDALDSGIALVTQEPTAVSTLTVAQNVLLPRLRSPRAPYASLSSGERVLAEVAKALVVHPRVLILDEVTTRLGEPQPLFEAVRALCAEGVGVVFITHRLGEIRALADRAVVLRDGEYAGALGPSELTDERITQLMVGRELSAFFERHPVAGEEVVLEVENLRVRGAREPVDFHVRAGEVLGLAGLVGAGRTELLETMAGLRPAVEGQVRVAGTSVRLGSPRAIRDSGVGFVPEERLAQGLIAAASITENVCLGDRRVLARVRRRAERQRTMEAVTSLGIRAPGVEAPVCTLSGGNQQKVVLARSLGHGPRVLLLDEPTRGIDVRAKQDLYRALQELLSQGLAIVLASSDMLELLGLADRILVLHERRVAGALERHEFSEEAIALLSAGGGGAHVGAGHAA